MNPSLPLFFLPLPFPPPIPQIGKFLARVALDRSEERRASEEGFDDASDVSIVSRSSGSISYRNSHDPKAILIVEQNLRELFELYDSDMGGSISVQDFHKFVEGEGLPLDVWEARALAIRFSHPLHDGEISYNQFLDQLIDQMRGRSSLPLD
mmetsp:Transcript_19556/g.74040  ORF Transcript_19556/g.74040 Transcript_19556/m.74040 type:complete len:152 (-) Transcript_19556:1189-1644(-)